MKSEIKQLLSQSDFQKMFSKTKTIGEAINLFKSKGIEISEKDLFESLNDLSGKSLSDNELASVAGGTSINIPNNHIRYSKLPWMLPNPHRKAF